MKNRLAFWLLLVVLIALGTVIVGWWTVPVIAAVYGLIFPDKRHWLGTALAGVVAWGLLLDITWFQGPVLELAGKAGGVLSLPAPAFIALTLIFPALLAGSAGELTAAARRLTVTEKGRAGARSRS